MTIPSNIRKNVFDFVKFTSFDLKRQDFYINRIVFNGRYNV